jgi:uncharacterized lipoprotein YehR (DUF1307 family)
MKKKNLFSAVLVCLLAFSLTGCGDNGDPSSPGGDGGPVGRWVNVLTGYESSGLQQFFLFRSDGTGTWGNELGGQSITWDVNGNKLTLYLSGYSVSVTYSVDNNQLFISNPTGYAGMVSAMAFYIPYSPFTRG